MKKFLTLSIILLLSFSAFSQKDVFKIKMSIKGMQDSACYLINYFGNQRYYKDTSSFNKDGVVIFSGK